MEIGVAMESQELKLLGLSTVHSLMYGNSSRRFANETTSRNYLQAVAWERCYRLHVLTAIIPIRNVV